MLQYIKQVIPELLYSGDKHPFIGRVYSLQGRPEGNHIQRGVFVEE